MSGHPDALPHLSTAAQTAASPTTPTKRVGLSKCGSPVRSTADARGVALVRGLGLTQRIQVRWSFGGKRLCYAPHAPAAAALIWTPWSARCAR